MTLHSCIPIYVFLMLSYIHSYIHSGQLSFLHSLDYSFWSAQVAPIFTITSILSYTNTYIHYYIHSGFYSHLPSPFHPFWAILSCIHYYIHSWLYSHLHHDHYCIHSGLYSHLHSILHPFWAIPTPTFTITFILGYTHTYIMITLTSILCYTHICIHYYIHSGIYPRRHSLLHSFWAMPTPKFTITSILGYTHTCIH